MSVQDEIQDGRDLDVVVPAPGLETLPMDAAMMIEAIRRNVSSLDEDPSSHRKRWFKEFGKTWMTVLASIVASVTYQAALNPPGGFWQADDSQGHQAGDPVLRDKHWLRYQAFYYLNATAFVTSLMIMVISVMDRFYDTETKTVLLLVITFVDIVSLIGAYVAGSAGSLSSSVSVIVIALVALVILFYIGDCMPDLFCMCCVRKMPVGSPSVEEAHRRQAEDRRRESILARRNNDA